jgi:hypothetical protein
VSIGKPVLGGSIASVFPAAAFLNVFDDADAIVTLAKYVMILLITWGVAYTVISIHLKKSITSPPTEPSNND